MDTAKICTNCLKETMQNGVCTSCGKRIEEHPPRQPNTLPEGYVLHNQYLLGRVVGKGGFGITYLARDIWQNRRVIVKELYPHNDVQRNAAGTVVIPLAGQEEYFEKLRHRFRQEARMLESFRNDPEVVDVYDTITENNTEYYSMEYLSGWDLRTLAVQKGKVSWNELSEYVKSILRTLNLLHSHNLIHRDISPDNIFLISQTEAKLIDFGSVRCYTDDRGMTTFLKPVYAPMEQYFSDGHQGPWTDIYSLSATVYHVMTGVKPPRASSRANPDTPDPLVPVGQLCPGLPPHVAQALMKGMAVRIENRFHSAREMAAALYPGEDIFVRSDVRNHEDIENKDDENRYVKFDVTDEDNGKDRFGDEMDDPDLGTGQRDDMSENLIIAMPEEPKKGIFTGFSEAVRKLFGQPRKPYILRCTGGRGQGTAAKIPEGTEVILGRDQAANIRYPAKSKGISRRQMRIRCGKAGELAVMDESTYGMQLNNRKMEKGQWYRVDRGSILEFAGETWRVE